MSLSVAVMDVPTDSWLAGLAPVLDTALDAVAVMNEQGLFVGWNRIAETTFGWPREEALGRRVSELIIPKRYRDAHQRGLTAYLETGDGEALRASRDEFRSSC